MPRRHRRRGYRAGFISSSWKGSREQHWGTGLPVGAGLSADQLCFVSPPDDSKTSLEGSRTFSVDADSFISAQAWVRLFLLDFFFFWQFLDHLLFFLLSWKALEFTELGRAGISMAMTRLGGGDPSLQPDPLVTHLGIVPRGILAAWQLLGEGIKHCLE